MMPQQKYKEYVVAMNYRAETTSWWRQSSTNSHMNNLEVKRQLFPSNWWQLNTYYATALKSNEYPITGECDLKVLSIDNNQQNWSTSNFIII